MFFAPNELGHPDNYVEADPLVTPPHIVPEWYFLPFYAILRSATFDVWFLSAKLLGVLLMVASVLILFVLPWLDGSPVRSARFRPVYKQVFWIFAADCVILGIVGARPPNEPVFGGVEWFRYVALGQIATAYYFFHFLVLVPLLAATSARGRCGEHRRTGARRWREGRGAMRSRAWLAAGLAFASSGAWAASEAPRPPALDWSFDGVFGYFDRAEAQRGLQVYLEVCASCHGLGYVAYRDLEGLGYDPESVKAIAALAEVEDGPDMDGEMFTRPARPSDRFVDPFPNAAAAAAANNGARAARSLVDGQGPREWSGLHRCPAHRLRRCAGRLRTRRRSELQRLVPRPPYRHAAAALGDDVEYADGTEATIERQARDVTAFSPGPRSRRWSAASAWA